LPSGYRDAPPRGGKNAEDRGHCAVKDVEAWLKFKRLKRLHDPANRFRFNANIPPADS